MGVSAVARLAFDAGNTLGEGVLWCDRTQSVYWTDIHRSTLWRLHPADGTVQQWTLPERLASFALCEAEHRLLLALASRLAFFDLSDGSLETLHEIEPGLATRANDGACDRQGRFVFGTLHEPASGSKQPVGGFYRLNADLSLERLALPGVAISNSIAFSPAGDIMYFCDSPTRRIHCCDYGDTLGSPRVFVDLGDVAGEPDGSTVDAEGALWNAQWGLGRVVRYLADGREDRIVRVPARQPTRPAFGGTDLEMLYITSARGGLSEAELSAEPQSGALFAFPSGVRGLVEPRFAGFSIREAGIHA
jgi:L-arabinonolactonase